MESMVDIAIRSEHNAFMRGAEAGFWKGYVEGGKAAHDYIMGDDDLDRTIYDDVPPKFAPLGPNYLPYNFATTQEQE